MKESFNQEIYNFIGKDRQSYPDLASLQAANQERTKRMFPFNANREIITFKGKDGQTYPDLASLQAANQKWNERNNFFLAKDGTKHFTTAGLVEEYRSLIEKFFRL